ncbi:MAG: hypothetical protein C5B49_14720 [Bdellovibrio sp.]|nr:MAG: hypothetical protein C5B49_14720 [Bdellovibrio sp.]
MDSVPPSLRLAILSTSSSLPGRNHPTRCPDLNLLALCLALFEGLVEGLARPDRFVLCFSSNI